MVYLSRRELRNTTLNFLIMPTIKNDFNTELLDQELNFDELQEINGAVDPIVAAEAAVGFIVMREDGEIDGIMPSFPF